MAGTLRLGEATWSAPSGLFCWVVDAVAARVPDQGTAALLREVSEHNLGWLDLSSPEEDGRRQVGAVLAVLPEIAERELPDSAARPAVLGRVRELAGLAGG